MCTCTYTETLGSEGAAGGGSHASDSEGAAGQKRQLEHKLKRNKKHKLGQDERRAQTLILARLGMKWQLAADQNPKTGARIVDNDIKAMVEAAVKKFDSLPADEQIHGDVTCEVSTFERIRTGKYFSDSLSRPDAVCFVTIDAVMRKYEPIRPVSQKKQKQKHEDKKATSGVGGVGSSTGNPT